LFKVAQHDDLASESYRNLLPAGLASVVG